MVDWVERESIFTLCWIIEWCTKALSGKRGGNVEPAPQLPRCALPQFQKTLSRGLFSRVTKVVGGGPAAANRLIKVLFEAQEKKVIPSSCRYSYSSVYKVHFWK